MRIIHKFHTRYKSMPLPVKASFWYIVCLVIQRCISFLTTPVFTRVMSTEQYGEVTLFGSWSGIVCIFTTLNLQAGSFGTAQVKFQDRRKQYISSIQTICTILTILALLLVEGFPEFWQEVFGMSKLLIVVLLGEVWAGFATNLWMANQRFEYHYKPTVALTLLQSIVGTVLGLIFVLNLEQKGTARIVTNAMVIICIGITIYGYNQYQGRELFDKEFWSFALSFNLPLIPYYLSQIVFGSSDRVMIARMAGNDKAGIYGLAYTIANFLTIVRSGIFSAYSPWLLRRIKNRDSEMAHLINKRLIVLFAVMLLAFVSIAPEFVYLMGGNQYMDAIWIVPPVTASILFDFFTDFSCILNFYHEKKSVLVSATMVSALINIILNYFGIKYISYMVAGYTTLVSFIVFWLMLYFGTKRICYENEINENDFIDIEFQIKTGLIFLAVSAVLTVTYSSVYIRYGLFFFFALVLMIKRKSVKDSVKLILSFKNEKN